MKVSLTHRTRQANGKTHTVYRVRWWREGSANGRREREFSKKEEAESFARRLRREIEIRNVANRTEHVSIAELIEDWRFDHTAGRAWRTRKNDHATLEHLQWFTREFPDLDARELRGLHLRKFVNFQLEKGLAGATIRAHLTALRRCINVGIEDGRIRIAHHIPWNKVMTEAVKATASAPKRRDAWDEREVGILLEEAKRDDSLSFYPALRFALSTGCRRGELLGLRWEDIDFAHRRINWSAVPTGEPGGALKPLKGLEAGDRVRAPFSMTDSIEAILRQQHRARVPRPEWVFPSPKGCQWAERNFARLWERVRARAVKRGVRQFPFHCTRHTYVTWSLEAGVRPATVAAHVGDRIETIWRHYAHAIREPDGGFDALSNVVESG